MRKPTTFSTRKPTDTNQIDRDLICPPVYPEVAKLSPEKCAPQKFSQRTMRVGKK